MSWMKDTYSHAYGHEDINAAGCVTGKASNQSGIKGRTESTGLGVFFSVKTLLENEEIAKKLGVAKGLRGKKFIV